MKIRREVEHPVLSDHPVVSVESWEGQGGVWVVERQLSLSVSFPAVCNCLIVLRAEPEAGLP